MAKGAKVWREIRLPCRGTAYGVDVVVLTHPWKGRWSQVLLEDLYGTSSFLASHLGVGEAKRIAKALVPLVSRRFADGGSVNYLPADDPGVQREINRVLYDAVDVGDLEQEGQEEEELEITSADEFECDARRYGADWEWGHRNWP